MFYYPEDTKEAKEIMRILRDSRILRHAVSEDGDGEVWLVEYNGNKYMVIRAENVGFDEWCIVPPDTAEYLFNEYIDELGYEVV